MYHEGRRGFEGRERIAGVTPTTSTASVFFAIEIPYLLAYLFHRCLSRRFPPSSLLSSPAPEKNRLSYRRQPPPLFSTEFSPSETAENHRHRHSFSPQQPMTSFS